MNRREFTASMAALVAAPALPLIARTAAAPAVPPGSYAWAQLIARAQNKCSPDMLARALHLEPGVADALFNDMIADGVLKTPGVTGIAQATKPIEATGLGRNAPDRLRSKAKELMQDAVGTEGKTPLVNPDTQGLGCGETMPEDTADASPDQHAQEISRAG